MVIYFFGILNFGYAFEKAIDIYNKKDNPKVSLKIKYPVSWKIKSHEFNRLVLTKIVNDNESLACVFYLYGSFNNPFIDDHNIVNDMDILSLADIFKSRIEENIDLSHFKIKKFRRISYKNNPGLSFTYTYIGSVKKQNPIMLGATGEMLLFLHKGVIITINCFIEQTFRNGIKIIDKKLKYLEKTYNIYRSEFFFIKDNINIYHPFIQTTIKEFRQGKTKKLTTKDHPKSMGLSLVLEYPHDWVEKEGKRPHIIKTISSGYANGPFCFLSIVKLYKNFSENDIDQLFEPGEQFENFNVISVEKTKYEGLPGTRIEAQGFVERAGYKFTSYIMLHFLLYSKKLIVIACSVQGHPSEAERIKKLFTEYKPLFILIGNSIILEDLWLSKDNFNNLNKDSSDNIKPSTSIWLRILFSFLITWSIGLTPPLLIRFIILKRPLSYIHALLVAFVLLIINLIIFIELEGNSTKHHPAIYLIFLVSYIILNKGYKKVDDLDTKKKKI